MINAASAVWGLLGVIVTALAGIVVAKVTSGGAERAAQAPVRLEMEAEAFTQAAEYWKATIAGLNGDVARLEGRMGELDGRATQSEERERTLAERVRVLEQVLAENNIPVPPWDRVGGH